MSITIEKLTGISDAFFRTLSSSLLEILTVFSAYKMTFTIVAGFFVVTNQQLTFDQISLKQQLTFNQFSPQTTNKH